MMPKFSPALTNLPLVYQGKTRDTFETNEYNTLLIVATDRLSTHNIVHHSTVPRKGEVLTALTIFWLQEVLKKHHIPHHLLAWGNRIFDYLAGTRSDYPPDLYRRAIVVRKLRMCPVEFIYRGYMSGSLWKEYRNGKDPYGLCLGSFSLMSKFSLPVFTPTQKSETDDPVNFGSIETMYPLASLRALKTFLLMREYLTSSGIVMIDTKFEFGVDCDGIVRLADEVGTPDSSRFCKVIKLKLGVEPPWLDKQIARDEAERIWGNGPKCPLEFRPEVVSLLSGTYLELLNYVTEYPLDQLQRLYLD